MKFGARVGSGGGELPRALRCERVAAGGSGGLVYDGTTDGSNASAGSTATAGFGNRVGGAVTWIGCAVTAGIGNGDSVNGFRTPQRPNSAPPA